MPIYLAFSPEEFGQAAASGHPLACMGYRLASDAPTLLAPSPLPDCRAMMLLQDDALPAYEAAPSLSQLIAEYAAAYHTGLICDCDAPENPFWTTLIRQLNDACAALSLPLWVSEAYADAAPDAWVTIGSDVSTGDFRQRAAQAAARYPGRCVLELRPLGAQYALPGAPAGKTLTPDALRQLQADWSAPVFHAPDLLCQYFSRDGDPLELVLFDTRETLREKLTAAGDAGFQAAVGLLQELSVRLPDESK
ncbi:MAG: hypothetical protein HFF17_07890 [Oscillospiraceae bacterium]|nr:hypothetical protein [Oscillospiraceae bacterium]